MARADGGGVLSSLTNAGGWINTPPLRPADLQGKVVLVQFWTYTCINWLRTLPYLRAWAEKYKDLVIVGVHSPEFDFEKIPVNVRNAVTEMRIGYCVALDPEHVIWDAFANQYWPALYLIGTEGRIRYKQFGEGDYERTERAIQSLLAGPDHNLAVVDARGSEIPADWNDLQSGENYLGYERTEGFVSPEGLARDRSRTYVSPPLLHLNQWALQGDWTMKRRGLVSGKSGAQISYNFHARDLHLVLGPGEQGTPIRFRVRIDGKPPETAHGVDSDDAGSGVVTTPRLYQLIRQSAPIISRQFDIEFLAPGVEAYVFTFG